MKQLALLLFLFPSLGACTMQDDYYYGNPLHRQVPILQVSDTTIHQAVAANNHHAAVIERRRATHARPQRPARRVPHSRHHRVNNPPVHALHNSNTHIVPSHN